MIVTLEPVRWPDDAERVIEFLLADEWPFHGTPRLTRELAAHIVVSDDDVVSFWVQVDQRAAGLIRVFDLCDLEVGSPLLDIRLVENQRGRGIGSIAVRLLTDHLFTTYPELMRIESTTRHDNIAMHRVFDRCGYRQEGRLVEAWASADRTRSDTLIFAMLRREWAHGSRNLTVTDASDR